MAIDVEHMYESCTCESGMRDGLRCADCGGRGIIPKGITPTGGVVEPADEDLTTVEGDDGLDDMSLTHLRSRAKDLGLPSTGSKAGLIAAIRAEVGTSDAGTEPDETEDSDVDESDGV